MSITVGEYTLDTDGHSTRIDTVWRITGKGTRLSVCRIYGDTYAIRRRMFLELFDEHIPEYSPLAHASVEPIDQSHPEAPEVFGYDVRGRK